METAGDKVTKRLFCVLFRIYPENTLNKIKTILNTSSRILSDLYLLLIRISVLKNKTLLYNKWIDKIYSM